MGSEDNERPINCIRLPLLPLRDVIVFPNMVMPLFVGRDKSIVALNAAMEGQRKILLVAQKNAQDDEPDLGALYEVGTIATILQLLKLPDGTVKVLVEGIKRAKLHKVFCAGNFLEADVESLGSHPDEISNKSIVLSNSLVSLFEQYAKLSKKVSSDVLSSLTEMSDHNRIIDTIAANISMHIEDKQKVIQLNNLIDRQEYVINILETEIDLLEVEKQVRSRVKKQLERSQREYYLAEQMKAIQKELGGDDEQDELSCLKEKIDKVAMPLEPKEKIQAEFKKLKQMSSMSAEATVVRSYIDWILNIPWKKKSRLRNDLQVAENILNKEHYGLVDIKECILEYLAVQLRSKKIKGHVLCLVGPPGVGKTSLGESIAKAVNRKFVRIALGGIRDEAEIRGHRRTYIGSMPGRIIQKITKSGVRNPLVLLDEVDKLGSDMRGDPASALLEVLDPKQNHRFNDHYLEVDYDLSDVMFICTSNSMDIPEPLLDRMEIISIPGYTEEEKINIAKQYFVAKQLEVNGLKKNELIFTNEAIVHLIRFYTKEAGVRSLERQINKICRKFVKSLMTNNKISLNLKDSATILPENIGSYIGVKKFSYGLAEEKDQVGIVTGLAWTRMGGELLNVEVVLVPGKGKVVKTGLLGDVMQESIQAALTVIRSRVQQLNIDPEFYINKDMHIHIPEGATPKDGPSAGVAMCTAMVSALTGIAVKADVAMTGEINLRSQVLPIGGLKEKLLAAQRGGIKTVLIPNDNVKDLEEVPTSIKNGLVIKPVKKIEEVLEVALQQETELCENGREVVVVNNKISSKNNRVNRLII